MKELLKQDNLQGFAGMGFDQEHVIRQIRLFSEYFFANYAASQGKSRWGDKSPAYVTDLDWIRNVFPDAIFVHIVREPLDQVHSFTDGGRRAMRPEVLHGFGDAEEDVRVRAARWWVSVTESQLMSVQMEPQDNYLVVYRELVESPETTLRGVLRFLQLPWNPLVLKFAQISHDVGREDNRIALTRDFKFSGGAWSKWPEAVRETCEELTNVTYSRLIQTAHRRAGL